MHKNGTVDNGMWEDVDYRFAGLYVRLESLPSVEGEDQQL